MALVVALALAIVIVALSGASVASAASTSITVGGTVRDDAGTPVAGRSVEIIVPERDATGSYSYPSRRTSTDAAGHYSFVVPKPADAWGTSLRMDGDDRYTGIDRSLGEEFYALRGTTLKVDLVVRRRNATVAGRVSVRDGGSPEGATVTVRTAGSTGGYLDDFTTIADPDGSFSVAVPPGRYRVYAESRYGLGGWAPDLPQVREDSPVTVVAAGRTAAADVSLRHRLAGPALDEYGMTQNGYERGLSDVPESAWGRYPVDPHRSVTSTIGPRLKAVISPPDGGDYAAVKLTITNTGDDDAWFGRIRFEGTDRFSCYPLSCNGTYVLPGKPVELIVRRDEWGDQRDFRTTVVVPLLTPSGTVRLPVAIHDPNPTQAQVEQRQQELAAAVAAALTPKVPAAHAPIARPGAGGDVGRILMTKNRLRVTFPAAGTATSVIDRAVVRRVRGKAKRRWRTVRRVALNATSAVTRVARIKRLPRGRYRVRTTYAIGTRTPRTTTTFWSIRR